MGYGSPAYFIEALSPLVSHIKKFSSTPPWQWAEFEEFIISRRYDATQMAIIWEVYGQGETEAEEFFTEADLLGEEIDLCDFIETVCAKRGWRIPWLEAIYEFSPPRELSWLY